MSQFLIATSKEKPRADISNITFQKATEGQSVFREAIDYFGIDPSHSWAVIDETGNTASSLFSEAGLALSQGDSLSTTRLGYLLGELLYSNCGLIAWYAYDYQDVVQINNVIALVEHLNQELPVGFGNVYFTYRL